jgi:hypothetical protein
MHTIEIDFDVFKKLTVLRADETVTYNDVLRELLKLDPARKAPSPSVSKAAPPTSLGKGDWSFKGVFFKGGMKLRARHKGTTHYATVDNGLIVNGTRTSSPSDAARAVTNTSVNGWMFWEYEASNGNWRPIRYLR